MDPAWLLVMIDPGVEKVAGVGMSDNSRRLFFNPLPEYH